MDGVFLVPGAPQRFDTIFMPPTVSNVPARDQSVAVFLAKNDIDVWGLTYGWNHVPVETTDFSFMKGWGITKDSQYTAVALSIARGVRESSCQDAGTLHLLGFCYGVFIAYAVAGDETQLPQPLRNVKGLIPLDWSFKYPVGHPWQLSNCRHAADYKAAIDAGTYQQDSSFLMLLGDLALYYPNDPAPDWLGMPGLTNYQAALAIGIGFYLGGEFDPSGVPSLFYTVPRLWIDLLRATPRYSPTQASFDGAAVNCGEVPMPFAAISVKSLSPFSILARKDAKGWRANIPRRLPGAGTSPTW